jgi:hypothetical protein
LHKQRAIRWILSGVEYRAAAGVFRRGARESVDIVADILELCSSWTKKTKIMYNASLSYQMLKFYLSRYHNMTGLLAGPDGASSRRRSCPFARQR